MTGREFDAGFEGPSEADIERFGSDDRPCPECGTEIYADAPFCHVCGVALEGDETARPGRSSFVAIGAVGLIGLIAVIALV